jgi:hypothetical protein
MKRKHQPMSRVEQIITAGVFFALFLYLMFIVGGAMLMQMGVLD